MDFFSSTLEPHSDNLIKLAITVTTLQFLSGIFILLEVRKKGSTQNIPCGPFLGGIILCLLTLKFGMILRDDAMVKLNFVGLALNIFYMMYYYGHTPNNDKNKIWGYIGVTGLVCLGALAYTEYEDPKLIEFRLGMIITSILVCLVGMPFLSLGEIIRTKSTNGLPFPIILSGFIVSVSWMLYGLSIRNSVLAIQNFLLATMGLMQLSLFVIYPSSKVVTEKKKKN